MKSTLVILTLNEIEGVKEIYKDIPFAAIDETLLVDGGSVDGTIEFFKKRGIRVIVQTVRGRGEAFRLAREEAAGDLLVFFSPDGNEDPKDIPKIVSKLKEGNDMVIGSRFLKGAHNEEDEILLPWRAWANRVFTLAANIFWNRGKFITDAINGFRGVTKSAFDRMKIDACGFLVEYQMSVRAMKLNLKVAEFPTYESIRFGGESTAKSISTGILFVKFFFGELFSPVKLK